LGDLKDIKTRHEIYDDLTNSYLEILKSKKNDPKLDFTGWVFEEQILLHMSKFFKGLIHPDRWDLFTRDFLKYEYVQPGTWEIAFKFPDSNVDYSGATRKKTES
jgi:hypothetical protein